MFKIVSIISNDRLLLILALVGVTLVVSTLITSRKKKIRVKRKDQALVDPITAFMFKTIERIGFLKRIKDKLCVVLGPLMPGSRRKDIEKNIVSIMAYTPIFLLLALLIVWVVMQSWFARLAMFSLIILLPVFYVASSVRKYKRLLHASFPDFVSAFITQYAVTSNQLRAFKEALPNIPPVLRQETLRLIVSMSSASDYYRSLDEFAKRINDKFAYAFIELLKVGYISNESIIEALIDLEMYITEDRLEEQRKKEQLHDRRLNLYLLMAALPLCIVLNIIFLGDFARNFYFSSISGQLLIAVSIIAVVAVNILIYVEDRL